MISAKEKAKELVDNFTFMCKECDYDWNAKKCALIAVDEIMKSIGWHDMDESNKDTFWDDVKNEIQKL
jgi:hypothetical protein